MVLSMKHHEKYLLTYHHDMTKYRLLKANGTISEESYNDLDTLFHFRTTQFRLAECLGLDGYDLGVFLMCDEIKPFYRRAIVLRASLAGCLTPIVSDKSYEESK